MDDGQASFDLAQHVMGDVEVVFQGEGRNARTSSTRKKRTTRKPAGPRKKVSGIDKAGTADSTTFIALKPPPAAAAMQGRDESSGDGRGPRWFRPFLVNDCRVTRQTVHRLARMFSTPDIDVGRRHDCVGGGPVELPRNVDGGAPESAERLPAPPSSIHADRSIEGSSDLRALNSRPDRDGARGVFSPAKPMGGLGPCRLHHQGNGRTFAGWFVHLAAALMNRIGALQNDQAIPAIDDLGRRRCLVCRTN